MNWKRLRTTRSLAATRRSASGGLAVIEAIVGLVISLAVLATMAHLLALAASQRRVTEQRAVAVREAGNLMEQVMARPWTELASEKLGQLALSESCRQRLPDARLRVEATAEGEPASAQQIRIRIDWQDRAGQRVEPVQLVAWRYAAEEPKP